MFDTVWTIADIIKRAEPLINMNNMNLDKIQPGDKIVGPILKQAALATDIQGITGGIHFTSNGNRYYKVLVSQVERGRFRFIWAYDNKVPHHTSLSGVHWLGGKPHRASVTKKSFLYINFLLFAVLSVFACLGILFSLILMIFLVKNRNRIIVENSFWKLNFLMLIGALLLYASVPSLGVDTSILDPMDWVCLCRKYLLCFGFIFLFAPLFAKSYYAYRCFIKRKSAVEKSARRRMFIMTIVLISVTAALVVAWQLLNPLKRKLKELISYGWYISCSVTVCHSL